MRYLTIIILSSVISVLSGCSSTIETKTVCEKRLPLNLETPELVLQDVFIDVQSKDNKVYYIFDSENFRKMTENDLEILNAFQAQQKIIYEYKKYYN
jgi:uncharacterized lipoprotein